MTIDQLRQARALALQALCQFDAQGDDFDAALDAFVRDGAADDDAPGAPPDPDAAELAARMARGAWAGRFVYDAHLARCAQRWSVERMALIDRNVLRLGVYELLECPETPPPVVINEAVELARTFGDADSPAFVNGVLDAVWKDAQRAACAAAPAEPSGDASGGAAGG